MTDIDYKKIYKQGYLAGVDGKGKGSNPYKQSGHERDTKHEDELHIAWFNGWLDAQI